MTQHPSPPYLLPETVAARPGLVAFASKGAGERVLFLQGLGLAGCAWAPQLHRLTQHCACAWYDNRGIGNSPPEQSRVTITSLVRDAREVLDALGWERAHLVGHSMGGVIAQELAMQHPDRVSSLALLCTFRRGREALVPRRGILWHALPALLGTPSVRARALARMLSSEHEIARDGIEAITSRLAAAFGRPVGLRPAAARAQFRALAMHAGKADLSALQRLPALVISGIDDPMAPPAGGRRLAVAIAARRFVVLPDASHALPILQYDAVNGLLLEHLNAG